MDYTADFETTADPKDCRVWAWAICDIQGDHDVKMGTDIDQFLALCDHLPNCDMWFHNLAFDGEFIINYLLHHEWTWTKEDPGPKQFTTLISGMGKYYQIELVFSKTKRKTSKVTFKDSLKKLTMSVEQVAKAFRLPISKLSIDYELCRPRGWKLTQLEKNYIQNDVKIMAMALKQDFARGLTRLTTGADALANYKDTIGKRWKQLFPVIAVEMDTAIRKAYRGGWTYANPKYQATEDRPRRNIWMGSVYDKNSMYPSVMYSKPLPVGMPVYFRGQYKDDPTHPLYIQYVSLTAKLKADRLPTLQIKNNPFFSEHDYVIDTDGIVDLALTNIDLELLQDQYDVVITSYNGGYKFRAMRGMFCEYIDYWMHIKETTTGGERLRAKLMLNALYGKFATNPDVTGKMPYLKDDGAVGYRMQDEEFREPVYTPMGVFITAYARDDIVRNCQKIYPRFLYADTDSIHCIGWDELELDDIHPTRLGAWKHESDFDIARYIRAKTYAERVVRVGKLDDACEYAMASCPPYLDVKACGCPKSARAHITLGNFEKGLEVGGKLVPRHVNGGIVLQETTFTIK